LKSLGADETYNHRLPLPEQLEAISTITGGKCAKVFDASAMATETGLGMLSSGEGKKYFATTNDWMPIEAKEDITVFIVTLGDIGRKTLGPGTEERVEAVNNEIRALIPILEKWVASEELKPMGWDVVGDVGVEGILKALEVFGGRKSGEKKILARVGE
jgi:hypothetical protein